MARKWHTTNEFLYEEFPIFSLKKVQRSHPVSGKSFTFVRIDGKDWVQVFSLTDKEELMLVEQTRHGTDRLTLEVPGGCVEYGESPKDAAIRELREETGYHSDTWHCLGSFSPNPALMSMQCHTFLALQCTPKGPQELLADEDIKLCTIPLESLPKLILQGSIEHGVVLAGCMRLLAWLDSSRGGGHLMPLWTSMYSMGGK